MFVNKGMDLNAESGHCILGIHLLSSVGSPLPGAQEVPGDSGVHIDAQDYRGDVLDTQFGTYMGDFPSVLYGTPYLNLYFCQFLLSTFFFFT